MWPKKIGNKKMLHVIQWLSSSICYLNIPFCSEFLLMRPANADISPIDSWIKIKTAAPKKPFRPMQFCSPSIYDS